MKTISATEFKAKCLKLIDEVQRTGESIRITKRGRTVARLEGDNGLERNEVDWSPGAMKGIVTIVGDIMVDSTELVEWEALK